MKLAGSWLSKNIGPVLKSVLPGTALSSGYGLFAGGPKAALTYGVTDVLGSTPATLLGRYAGRNIKNENVRGFVEGAANFAGSMVGSEIGTSLLMGGQPQQIAQQIEQRSVVNHLPLLQQELNLSPGTQYQLSGLSPGADFQKLLLQQLNPTEQALFSRQLSLGS